MGPYTLAYLIFATILVLSNSPMRRVVVKLAIVVAKGALVAILGPTYAARAVYPTLAALGQSTVRMLKGIAYANIVLLIALIAALKTDRNNAAAMIAGLLAVEATTFLLMYKTGWGWASRAPWIGTHITPADAYGIGMLVLLLSLLGVIQLTFPWLMTGPWANVMCVISFISLMIYVYGVIANKHTLDPHKVVIGAAIALAIMMFLHRMVPWTSNPQLGALTALTRATAALASAKTYKLSRWLDPDEVPAATQAADSMSEEWLDEQIKQVNDYKAKFCTVAALNALTTEQLKADRRKACLTKAKQLNDFKLSLKKLKEEVGLTPSPTPDTLVRVSPTAHPLPGGTGPGNGAPCVPPTWNGDTLNFPAGCSGQWFDIGIDSIAITASGTINHGGKTATPSGSELRIATPLNWAGLTTQLPLAALVGKIGANGNPFVIVDGQKINNGGQHIFIAINDSDSSDNRGNFTVVKK